MPNYIYIAKAALRDLGSIRKAAYYCERIAAQRGADYVDYQHAAESLKDCLKNRDIGLDTLWR
jgi:hypothetical protein